MDTVIVAKIEKDHLFREGEFADIPTRVGKEFHYDAMVNWWGFDLPDVDGWLPKARTSFKLYDDDNELYYEGWLLNDDECIVQQFVLTWAMGDEGCTLLEVYNENTKTWTMEIG